MVESCDGVYSEESNEIIGAIAQTPIQKRKKERKGQHNYLFASLSVRSFQLYLPQPCLFSHLFFFFVFKLKVLFFFCFCLPSAYIRQVADSSSLVDLPSTKREKKKKRTTVTAIRAPAVLLLLLSRLLFLRLASLFLPFSENLQSNRFFFISSFLLLFYSAAVYIRTAAFRSSYFTPLFSRF